MNMTEQILELSYEEEETQVKDGKAKNKLKRHFLGMF